MKTSCPILLLAGLLALGVCSIASAQNRLPVAPMSARPGFVSQTAPTPPEMLSTNYQVTFAATSEGKPLGELSMLTCSSEVSVSGPLNSGMTPTSFTVTGSLNEKDGELLFRYGIGFNYPVTTSTISSKPDGAVSSNVQYQQHSSQGMLRMKAGTPYEVLKAAGVIYTITITPAQTTGG